MGTLSYKSTVYFDPAIHQVLRIKSAFLNLFLSETVADALRMQFVEDEEVGLLLKTRKEKLNHPVKPS